MGLTNPIFLCKVSSDRVADTCVACDQRGSCGNSFFSYPEDIAMTKPFLTFQVQISFLEQDKNLLVENHTFAEAMLTQIGYFSLIGGYKTPFKNHTTQKYKDGIRLEDIVALYHFPQNRNGT